MMFCHVIFVLLRRLGFLEKNILSISHYNLIMPHFTCSSKKRFSSTVKATSWRALNTHGTVHHNQSSRKIIKFPLAVNRPLGGS
jgi:hypothetical protein